MASNEMAKTKYFEVAKKVANDRGFKLVIFGKDPYPKKPNGIPFCKDSFEEMNENCCGRHILQSVTGEKFKDLVEKYNGKHPSELFIDLLNQEDNILFLNLSTEFISGKENETGKNSKEINEIITSKSFDFNSKFLSENSQTKLVLCGKFKLNIFKEKYTNYGEIIEGIPHPSVYNRNNPKTKGDWQKYWNVGMIKNTFLK